MILRRYKYEFEWKHTGAASIISSMTVRTPKADKHVETVVNGTVVYGMMDDTPVVHMQVITGLQHIEEVVKEIKRERQYLLGLELEVTRTVKATGFTSLVLKGKV